jgi:hypothetical protein
MKFFVAAFVLFVIAAVCAFAQQPAQSTTQTVWQYGLPVHRMAIQNTAPWSCRLVTVAPVGKLGRAARTFGIADLAPGETAFAGEKKRKGGLINPFSKPSLVGYDRSSDLNIPIIALYFTDVEGVASYIGAASGNLYVPGSGNSSVSQLTFGPQNIRFADDQKPTAPRAEPQLSEKPVLIPYFGTDGTAIQIIVWNSSTPARVTVNGGAGDDIKLGDVKIFVGWSPITVTVSAIDPAGIVKTWSQGFQNSNYYGTYAQVFILGISDLH